MSGAQFVDARQARLIRALDSVVDGVYERYGVHGSAPPSADAVRAAIVDAAQAAVREFGPRPEDEARDEATPMRELPTEPGAVVLADEVRGEHLDPPVLLVRLHDFGSNTEYPWRPVDQLLIDDYAEHADRHVTGWVPARVVRDDEQGPVIALRRIAAAVRGKDAQGCIKTLQAVEFAAREALKRLDGEAP